RRLADHEVGAGQLVGRLERQEGAVLTDPGLGHAETVGDDDLLEILVVAQLGDLVVTVAVREDADLHRLRLVTVGDRWPVPLALSSTGRGHHRLTRSPWPVGSSRIS